MIIAVLQARSTSMRLPGKVLKPVVGTPVLVHQVERLKRARLIDYLVVATSRDPADDALVEVCRQHEIDVGRGSLEDVLGRIAEVAKPYAPDAVVRLTGDCPLADWEVVDTVVQRFQQGDVEYASNINPPTWPDGLDVEVISFDTLVCADREARSAYDREHVTPYIRRAPDRFPSANVASLRDLSAHRWTLDEAGDLDFVRAVYENLYPDNAAFRTPDILNLLERRPDLKALNDTYSRNQGSLKDRYSGSTDMLNRAKRHIPLGSQTFSKSAVQFPVGAAPLFIDRGDRGHVWDVDGNEYIDLVSGLLPVVLGYRDPDVDQAIRAQLDKGITFSLPSPVETELAERLCTMIPCAEMVRFGKNGTDATSGAIRVARAFTGRDRVIAIGYHGWQDWYIGTTTRNKGVPDAVSGLTHKAAYNDLAAVKQILTAHRGEVAAIILEPMSTVEPAPGYLQGLQQLAHEFGALLVFDEVITGFRFAEGGAQQYFGVTPDLAAFGKAMGNGMPISAVVGRADVMREMEVVFFSSTFGGETLSIAAAIAVVDKLRREPVIDHLWELGQGLADGILSRLDRHGLDSCLGVMGKPPWTIMSFADHPQADSAAIRTLYMTEMLRRGVLTAGSHNLCYAHDAADCDRVLQAYDETLSVIASELATGRLRERLPVPPIKPVFQVRAATRQ